MKEGWEYKSLGDVCEILDSRRKPITKNKRESGTIPYYGATGILDYVKDYIFDEKLVLLGEDGAKWGAGENSAYIVEGKTWVNNHAHALRPKREHLIDELLVYYLNFANLQPFITGVTVPKLNQEKMRSIEIPVPPLSEQQSIVDYFDAAFAKIDAMKANAEKALNEAKALFQASLREMLEPKGGWEEKALGELSDKIGDGLHGTPKYTDDGEYFFVNGNNLENGIIEIKDNTKRVNHDEYEKFKLDLNSSTVLLSINGTIGKTAFYNGEPIILGKSACYINVLPALLKEYLRYYLVSDGFFNYVKSNSRQATITNLGLKEIRRMPIPTPSLDEQQSIVATLDSLKSKVDRLQENYNKISQECDALKQAILRQVFE